MRLALGNAPEQCRRMRTGSGLLEGDDLVLLLGIVNGRRENCGLELLARETVVLEYDV